MPLASTMLRYAPLQSRKPMTASFATRLRSGFSSDYQYGVAILVFAAVCWSSTGLFIRLIPADAWTQLFWRGFFGGMTALVYVILRDGRGTLSTFGAFGWRGWIFTLCNTAAMLGFITSMKLTTVAHVTIIYATMPLVAALLSWIVLKEVPRVSSIVASLLAGAGVILTVVAGAGEGALAGDAIAMFMTLATVMALVVQRGGHTEIEPIASAAAAGFLCALASAPFSHPFDISAYELAMLVLFGMVNTGFGFMLFFFGAKFVPATVAGLIGALDAPLAPFWVWLVLGETPIVTTLIGGAIVIAVVAGHIIWTMRSDRSVPTLH